MSEDVAYYEATRQGLVREIAARNGSENVPLEIRNRAVGRVLDIGCGVGQALYPLAVKTGAFGVGVDVSNYSLGIGVQTYKQELPDARVAFVNTQAENLPFASETFDVVNFGLALPYTHNPRAIAEVQRVLKPGGLLFLKIHHLRYYLTKLQQGLLHADVLSVIHCGRVLTNGTIYHMTGRQLMTRILNETFQTRWLLRRQLAKSGLVIDHEQPGNPAAPALVIRKADQNQSRKIGRSGPKK